jgi:hypothetical protein
MHTARIVPLWYRDQTGGNFPVWNEFRKEKLRPVPGHARDDAEISAAAEEKSALE